MEARTIRPAPIRKSITVEAEAEKAFSVFTAKIGRWWPATHSIGTAALRDVVIEPRTGRPWFERGEDGSECMWGKVLVWEPPARLVLAWQISGEWRYDNELVTELEVRFLPEGEDATKVELEHRNLERLGDKRRRHGRPLLPTAAGQGCLGAMRRASRPPRRTRRNMAQFLLRLIFC